MANIKISELPEANSVQNDDLLTIIQEGTNKKVTKEILLQEVNSDISDIQSEQITQNADIQENETKIQELEQEIQSLKEASYKVIGTGTDITLNNTSNNKFLQLDVKGNTEQTQYSGKNLMLIDNLEEQTINGIKFTPVYENNLLKYININGTATDNSVYLLRSSFFQINSGSYVLSGCPSGGSWTTYCLSYGDKMDSGNGNAFTLTESFSGQLYIRVGNETTVNNIKFYPMIRLSSTTAGYEPYCGGTASPNPEFPQPIYNVTGDVNVKIQNKNLLEPLFDSKTQNGITIEFIEEGMKVSGNTTSQYQYFVIFEKELPAGDYVINGIQGSSFSSYILGVYKNNTNIGFVSSSNFTFTLTEPATIKLYFFPYATNYSTPKIFKYQLEENSTATSYVAHEEQNLPFTLGTQRLYEGSNLADDGIHNKSKRVILDGTETWSQNGYATTTNTVGFLVTLDNIVLKNTDELGYLCNRFTAYGGSRWASDIEGIVQMGTKQIMIKINKSRLSSENVAGFKTWLSNNNIIVEYELETEETETYNETQQAQYNAIKEAISYYGQTHISSTSNEASAKIDATAIGDLNLVIS